MSERIKATCSTCNAQVQVAAKHAGKSLKCPKFQASIVVPLSATVYPPQLAVHDEQQAVDAPPKIVVRAYLPIIACVLSGIACVLGCVAVIMARSSLAAVARLDSEITIVNESAAKGINNVRDAIKPIEALDRKLTQLSITEREHYVNFGEWKQLYLDSSDTNAESWFGLAKREIDGLTREAAMENRVEVIERRLGITSPKPAN